MVDKDNALRVRLTEAARMGVAKYNSEYVKSFEEILAAPSDSTRIFAEVRASGINDTVNAIKVASLYNDTSLVDIQDEGGEQSIIWLASKGVDRISRDGKIEIRFSEKYQELVQKAVEERNVGFGFWMPDGDRANEFLNDVALLIERGRIIPRPRRTLFLGTGERTSQGGRKWQALPAAPGLNPNNWHIESEDTELASSTATELVLKQEKPTTLKADGLASEIVLPYLQGISLSDYAKILDDEDDILTEFRIAMKELAKEARSSNKTADEFRKDVVDPRVAKIDRAFRRIESSYRIRAAGSVLATATLTLVTLATGGIAGAIAAAAGTAGFVATAKEVADRNDKIKALKDDPLHLLWRLKK